MFCQHGCCSCFDYYFFKDFLGQRQPLLEIRIEARDSTRTNEPSGGPHDSISSLTPNSKTTLIQAFHINCMQFASVLH